MEIVDFLTNETAKSITRRIGDFGDTGNLKAPAT